MLVRYKWKLNTKRVVPTSDAYTSRGTWVVKLGAITTTLAKSAWCGGTSLILLRGVLRDNLPYSCWRSYLLARLPSSSLAPSLSILYDSILCGLLSLLCSICRAGLNQSLQSLVVHIQRPQGFLLLFTWLPEEKLYKGLVISFQLAFHTPFYFVKVISRQVLQRLASKRPLLRIISYHQSLSCIFQKLLAMSCNPAFWICSRLTSSSSCSHNPWFAAMTSSPLTACPVHWDIDLWLIQLGGVLEELEMTLSVDSKQLSNRTCHDFVQDFKFHFEAHNFKLGALFDLCYLNYIY